jgi:hypothetical protein
VAPTASGAARIRLLLNRCARASVTSLASSKRVGSRDM